MRFCLYGLIVALGLAPASAVAITINIDYRYDDTNNFFDPATADGAAARATIEAAASFFSDSIIDSLDAIPFTDPNTPGGQNTPVWRQVFTHPGTGQNGYAVSSAASSEQDGLTDSQGAANEFRDIQISANEFLIYAGGTSLGSIGQGGTGVGTFGSGPFNENITQRGKPSTEYSAWGGSIAFNNDATTNWNFDFTQAVSSGETDLYSVALHEIGHVLGLNTGGDIWTTWQVGNEYRGPESLPAWKAEDPNASPSATGIPTVSGSDTHWRDSAQGVPSIRSYILGTTTLQETAMDPTILNGTRKLFTNVDTYALRDIGWNVPNSVFEVLSPADYDGDGDVDGVDRARWETWFGINSNADADGDGDTDGADFLVWQQQYTGDLSPLAGSTTVPEPASGLLCVVGALLVGVRRCRRCCRRR